MRVFIVLVQLIMLLTASRLWATDYYVDLIAGNCSGNYSIANRNCTGSSGTSYNHTTVSSMAVTAGDTLYFRGGTYTTPIALGSKTGSAAGGYITLKSYQGEVATIRPTSSTTHSITHTCSTGYFVFDGFVFDGINAADNYRVYHGGGTTTCSVVNHHLTFSNNDMKNYDSTALAFSGIGHRIFNNKIHDMRSTCTSGDASYGFYYYTGGGDTIFEGNEVYNTPGGYFQATSPMIARRNYFHDNAYCSGMNYAGVFWSGSGTSQFYDNIVVNNGLLSRAAGLKILNPSNILIRNNTFYNNKTYGIDISSGAVGMVCENNLIIGNGSGAINGPCTQITNRTTGAITDCTVSTTDFTQKPSSSCYRAGTARAGFTSNSTPDIGAHDAFIVYSATITGNTMEVLLQLNHHTPVIPTPGGWSVTCQANPTACPAPAVTSVTLKPGTSSTVVITFSGAACSTGQDWNVEYNSALGNTTDSFAWFAKQELMSASILAINNCTGGGGPSPPAGLYIHYKFNEGSGVTANDETVNNLDCTLTNGATWGQGNDLTGMVTAPNTAQHCVVAYGNGVNPSSQSLSFAFWAKLPASPNGGYFGVPVGSNQRLYVSVVNNNWRMAVQASGTSSATEFTAVPNDWTRVCVTMNSSTDTATLHINGVASTSAGGVKSYTSYVFAGNFTIGLFDPSVNVGPGGTFDEFKLWTSVISCADDYSAASPPSTPYVGTLSIMAMKVLYAKPDAAGAVLSLADVNTNVTLPPGAIFTVASEMKCTVQDCSAVGTVLYYTCAACPSTGTALPVPDTASTDGIEFYGPDGEPRLLAGAHATLLSDGVTAVNVSGGTNLINSATPVLDLGLNHSTVMRRILRIPLGTETGRTYCFKPREQTGVVLNSYTPSGGICVTVGTANGGM